MSEEKGVEVEVLDEDDCYPPGILTKMPRMRFAVEGERKPQVYELDEGIAARVKELGSLGFSKTQAAIGARITPAKLDRHYLEYYTAGRALQAEEVAKAAMEQVRAGNVQMIQFVAKTRLGWNETNVVEHIGEVRSVVSALPMSKEEFAAKYLENKDNTED